MATYKIVSIDAPTQTITLDVTIGGTLRTWKFRLRDVPTDSIASFEAWLKAYIAAFKAGLAVDSPATPDGSVTGLVGTNRNVDG